MVFDGASETFFEPGPSTQIELLMGRGTIKLLMNYLRGTIVPYSALWVLLKPGAGKLLLAFFPCLPLRS